MNNDEDQNLNENQEDKQDTTVGTATVADQPKQEKPTPEEIDANQQAEYERVNAQNGE